MITEVGLSVHAGAVSSAETGDGIVAFPDPVSFAAATGDAAWTPRRPHAPVAVNWRKKKEVVRKNPTQFNKSHNHIEDLKFRTLSSFKNCFLTILETWTEDRKREWSEKSHTQVNRSHNHVEDLKTRIQSSFENCSFEQFSEYVFLKPIYNFYRRILWLIPVNDLVIC